MQLVAPPPPPIEEAKGVFVGQTDVSLDELWKTTPKQTIGRI
jgi:hypothetical protein